MYCLRVFYNQPNCCKGFKVCMNGRFFCWRGNKQCENSWAKSGGRGGSRIGEPRGPRSGGDRAAAQLEFTPMEKMAFFCILATDRQTDKQTDEQMHSIDARQRAAAIQCSMRSPTYRWVYKTMYTWPIKQQYLNLNTTQLNRTQLNELIQPVR